jgi:hypothetical protein
VNSMQLKGSSNDIVFKSREAPVLVVRWTVPVLIKI